MFVDNFFSVQLVSIMENDEMLNRLSRAYFDKNSPIFLTKDINRIVKFTKKTPGLVELTKSQIVDYQSRIEALSRGRERRLLRGRKRYLSRRKWVSSNHGHKINWTAKLVSSNH